MALTKHRQTLPISSSNEHDVFGLLHRRQQIQRRHTRILRLHGKGVFCLIRTRKAPMQRWQRIISGLWTWDNTAHFLGGVKSGVKLPLKSPANGRCCLKFVENICTVQSPQMIDKQRKSRSFNNYGICHILAESVGFEPIQWGAKALINQGFLKLS